MCALFLFMVFKFLVMDLTWLLCSEPSNSPDSFENIKDIVQCYSRNNKNVQKLFLLLWSHNEYIFSNGYHVSLVLAINDLLKNICLITRCWGLGFFPFVPFYLYNFSHNLLGNTRDWALKKTKVATFRGGGHLIVFSSGTSPHSARTTSKEGTHQRVHKGQVF